MKLQAAKSAGCNWSHCEYCNCATRPGAARCFIKTAFALHDWLVLVSFLIVELTISTDWLQSKNHELAIIW